MHYKLAKQTAIQTFLSLQGYHFPNGTSFPTFLVACRNNKEKLFANILAVNE